MNMFLSCNKKEAIQLRDLLNELLSDPELDREDCNIVLDHKFGRINVARNFKVSVKEDEES